MNIYRPFVLRVFTGEAEVLDHEQMKPCNQSVIQAAVKVRGCTLHAFQKAYASMSTAVYLCGASTRALARADASFIANRVPARCTIAIPHFSRKPFSVKLGG